MAGLDPAIHAALQLAFAERPDDRPFSMDHRVKPGGDDA